jgi:hypothetical protein
MQNPTKGQLATGVKRRIRDKGGVSSTEYSQVLEKLSNTDKYIGMPKYRPVVRPSGGTFMVSDTWDDGSSIHLTAPQEVDTSDRSLVRRSEDPNNANFKQAARPIDMGMSGGFDSKGFEEGRGLQRDLFYWRFTNEVYLFAYCCVCLL